MKPMFTVHAGEFIFAETVEKKFPKLRLWMPTKDTGVDFLITDAAGEKTTTVQVKMSRDYRPAMAQSVFDQQLSAAGWFVFTYKALTKTAASTWSLILVSPVRNQKPIFLNICPRILLQRLIQLHGEKEDYHLYPWVLKNKSCIDGRGMKRLDKRKYIDGNFDVRQRDMTDYLENWDFLTPVVN